MTGRFKSTCKPHCTEESWILSWP